MDIDEVINFINNLNKENLEVLKKIVEKLIETKELESLIETLK